MDGDTISVDEHWSHSPAIPKKSSSKTLSLNMKKRVISHKTDFDIFLCMFPS